MYLNIVNNLIGGFLDGWHAEGCSHHSRSECISKDQEMRNNMSEDQLDKMLRDSFPASDSAARY